MATQNTDTAIQPTKQLPAERVPVNKLTAIHREIETILPHWKRIQILVDGDEDLYKDREIFLQLPKETSDKHGDRWPWFLNGFFNPSQDLVTLKGDYIVRRGIERKLDSKELKAFAERADRSGETLNDFMRRKVAINLDAYGTVFAVVDKPRAVFADRASEIQGGMPYLCILDPQQVVNFAFNKDGSLAWFRYQAVMDDELPDPFNPVDSCQVVYVTWTEQEYFVHNAKGERTDYFLHNFGVVPVVIQAAFVMDDDDVLGSSTFFTASRQIVMGNNLLSVANYEIAKFGTVLMVDSMDWQDTPRKRDPNSNVPQMTAPTTAGDVMPVSDMNKKPEYLTKDIEIIDKANAQAHYYFELAAISSASGQEASPLVADRTSNNPASGVAKAYDFQDVDANLASFAKELESFELKVLKIVAIEMKVPTTGISVIYPKNFDVRGFVDKVDRVAALQKIKFPSETGLRAAMHSMTPDLTNDEKIRTQIDSEIDEADVLGEEAAAAADIAALPLPQPPATAAGDPKVIPAAA
jgi:hypothetical protein